MNDKLANIGNTDIESVFDDGKSFQLAMHQAEVLASSTMVPQDYRGNVGNCIIALNAAKRQGVDPLAVMQNLYIVHGRPGWFAQYLIGLVNACGRFSPLDYDIEGTPGKADCRCRAYAIRRSDKKRLDGTWITAEMVKKEGWLDKKGSKWQTMPEQMYVYRAAAFWQRKWAPELSLGMYTEDELQDIVEVPPAEVVSRVDPMEAIKQEAAQDTPRQPDMFAELKAEMKAQDLGGKWFNAKCEDYGWNSANITEQQVSQLLDELTGVVK